MLAPDHPIALRLIAAVRAGSVDALVELLAGNEGLSDDVEAIDAPVACGADIAAGGVLTTPAELDNAAWLARH